MILITVLSVLKGKEKKIVLLANTSWYLYNFRSALIDRLISEDFKVIIVAPRDNYTKRLLAKDIIFINWNLDRRSINPLKELYSIISLIVIYSKCSQSITHNFTMKGCLYSGIAARLSTRSTIINHVTGLGPTFFSHKKTMSIINTFLIPIYKFAFNGKSSKTIFHNNSDKSTFEHLKICRKRDSLVINGSGVDTEYFSPIKNNNDTKMPYQIIFPSRIIKEKGFLELLHACKVLWNEEFDFVLNIVGDIDIDNRSSMTKEEIDLISKRNNKIIFHGRVESIRDLYQKADLVVLPSWREGLSLSLIEASSMGLPIITTDVPGCKDIVENKVSGIIVPPKEPLKLKEAIKYFFLNRSIAELYGKNARLKAINKYSVSIINEYIMKVYYQIHENKS